MKWADATVKRTGRKIRRREGRRFAFALALAAILQPTAANLAFVIATLLPQAPAQAAFSDAGYIEICTAGGLKRVPPNSLPPESNGEDQEKDGTALVLDYCPACHIGGQPAILVAAQVVAADYPAISAPAVPRESAHFPARRPASDIRNRAPPVLQA